MKKFLILFVLLFSGVNFTSCDQVKELADIPFNFTVSEDIPVVIDANSGAIQAKLDRVSFDEYVVLSIDNSDTHDYLNKLKSVSIKSLSYKFMNYSGASDGNIKADLTADSILLESLEEYVKEISDSGKLFKIDKVDDLNKIADRLKTSHQVTARISGNASGPMQFTLHIVMEVKVVANPL